MYSLCLIPAISLHDYYIKDHYNHYLCVNRMTLQAVENTLALISMSRQTWSPLDTELIATFNSAEELIKNYPELFI